MQTNWLLRYYANKLAIEVDGSFKDGLVTCMEKMVGDNRLQDKIMDEINTYTDEEGSFGRDIGKRQRRNKSFDPGEYLVIYIVLSSQIRSYSGYLTLVFTSYF